MNVFTLFRWIPNKKSHQFHFYPLYSYNLKAKLFTNHQFQFYSYKISRQNNSLIISSNSTPCTVIISTQSYSLNNNQQFQLYSYRISRQSYWLIISSNYTPCTVIISRQSYSHIDKNVVICYKTIYDIFEVLEYKKEKHELISKC